MSKQSERLESLLQPQIQRVRELDLYRRRRVVDGDHGLMATVDGRNCHNFCGNDYLGLASDPRLRAAAIEAIERCGVGSVGSPLVCGYNREHAALEAELAEFTGRPRALLFSTGWAANLAVMRALLGRGDVIIADELNHASLIDGARLSGAEYVRVAHRSLDGYAAALESVRDALGTKLVVSDSIFSMDGDLADLPALSELCERHGALLMIDDAHGFGVLGDRGQGAWAAFDAPLGHERLPIYVATLGKAMGAAGAFVAGSETLIEFLIQKARPWIFSTAAPPAIAAAVRAALGILQRTPEIRSRLHGNIAYFRMAAAQAGIPVSDSSTPIQPLVIGDSASVLTLARFALERGYWVHGYRPPTVPAGTARLRITLSAGHALTQIEGLVGVLAEGLASVGRLPSNRTG